MGLGASPACFAAGKLSASSSSRPVMRAYRRWDDVVAQLGGEPQGVALASAMAGATVTVGSLGGVAADFARGQPATVEGMQDPLVAFGYAVDQEASAEAAW